MEIAARSQPVRFVLLDDHRSPDPAVAADGDHGVGRRLAASASGAGVRLADVTLMSPMPGTGLRTPALASGPSARHSWP